MNTVRKDAILATYGRDIRIDLDEQENVNATDELFKSVRDWAQRNKLPNSPDAVAGTAVDAAKRFGSGIGLSPIRLIRYLSGETGRARGPFKFELEYRPMSGPLRDTLFSAIFTLKNTGNNFVRWGVDFKMSNQPPRSSEFEYQIMGDTYAINFSTPTYELPAGLKVPSLTLHSGIGALGGPRTRTSARSVIMRAHRGIALPPQFQTANQIIFQDWAAGKYDHLRWTKPYKWDVFDANPQWAVLKRATQGRLTTDHMKIIRDSLVRPDPRTGMHMLAWAITGPVQTKGGGTKFVHIGDPVSPDDYDTWLATFHHTT